MQIPNEFNEVGVAIAEDRLVAALKDMAGLVIATIVVLAIGKLNGLHRVGQGTVAGFQQEVHMVGHEHIAVERRAVAQAIAFEAFQIGTIVDAFMKDRCSAIPSEDHMIAGAGKVEPRFARHATKGIP